MRSVRQWARCLAACLLAGASFTAEAASATGTGFFITPQGHIATNYHVIEGSTAIKIKDSNDRVFPANIVLMDPTNDLAVLQINDISHPALPIKTSSSIAKGSSVFTMGFPNASIQGMESKVTEGIISSLSGIEGQPNAFQISVPIQPGNSGGPLLDFSGNVVGLTSSGLNAGAFLAARGQVPQNVNYAVKSNYLLELLRTKEHIVSKVALSNADRPVPLPTLVSRIEKSVVFILVELEERKPKAAERPQQRPEAGGGEPKYASDAIAIKRYELGLEHFQANRYAEALMNFGESASRGHRGAQYYMGEIYYNGRGVGINYFEAFSWYKKSAEQGLAIGQMWVCQLYLRGHGVEKSEVEAAKWCESAARGGELWAQHQIGFMYSQGKGVSKDDAKAFEWMKKSVDAGYDGAEADLAFMYYNGSGTPRNYAEAFPLALRAAKRGNARAQNLVGIMYSTGRGVAVDLETSFRWFQDSANRGDHFGQINTGVAYERGRGVASDEKQAIAWYQKAAAQNNEDARRLLAALLEKQKNAPPTPARSPIGDIVEVNPSYGYAVVKTSIAIAENTPLVIEVSGKKITAKAARQAGEKLSITLDGAELTAALVGVPVYQNK